MVDGAPSLLGARVKIDRAKHHLSDLEAAVRAYHADNPYKIVADMEAKPGHVVYRFHYVRPIPAQWGAIVGDIVHALRSSLDNLATALVIHNGTTSRGVIRETYFPIGADEEVFQGKLRRDLRGASPAVRQIVQRLKPYKGGTEAFWRLHQLDILDKHTALIPVGAGHYRVGLAMPVPTEFKPHLPLEFPVVEIDVTPALLLEDGHELLVVQAPTPTEGIAGLHPERQKQKDHEFSFTISFGKDQVVDGQPLIPTLKQIIDFTEGVVEMLVRNVIGDSAWR